MISVNVPTYVPFEPRTDEQRSLRAELRRRISELQTGPGEILYARFVGALPAGADVENALFYNLDARGVFAAMSVGVSFEFSRAPQGSVRYEYDTGPVEPTFRHWREERPLAGFDAPHNAMKPQLASIWWALRSTPGCIKIAAAARRQDEPFLLKLDIEGPTHGLTSGLLKSMLDGTTCALQSERDAVGASTVAPLIADGLGVAADAVLNALVDPTPSALGSRTRFVHRHGEGVKWEPDDDCCVAARVLFSRARQWRVTGTVATALA